MRRPVLLLLPFLALAAPARAATIDFAASTFGAGTVTDLGLGPGTLALEVDLQSDQEIRLAVDTETGEGPIAFDALFFNFLSADLEGLVLLLLGGASFAPGDAADSLGRAAGVSGGGIQAGVFPVEPEPTLLAVGDPLGAGATSWEIDASGVTSGRFELWLTAFPVPVPEPALAPWMLLAALAAGLRATRSRAGTCAAVRRASSRR